MTDQNKIQYLKSHGVLIGHATHLMYNEVVECSVCKSSQFAIELYNSDDWNVQVPGCRVYCALCLYNGNADSVIAKSNAVQSAKQTHRDRGWVFETLPPYCQLEVK